ncbi:MAG: TonB family protein [Salinisphaeraceae bacterium]|nr:TonB family protein [Salinisphaeraceae bacterium]
MLAVLASLCLHVGVVSALILYPAAEIKIDIPPVIKLVKLAPPPAPEPDPAPVAKPEPLKPPPPPPPPKQASKPKPKPAPVIKPAPLPKPKPVAKKPTPKPVAKPRLPEPAPPVETVAKAEPQPVTPAPAPPQPVYQPVNVQAAYLNNPQPAYPRIAARRGWEGKLMLSLDLDKNGNPTRVEVIESSGHRVLDKAAQAAIKRWRFQPATKDGKAVPAQNVKVPWIWELKNS